MLVSIAIALGTYRFSIISIIKEAFALSRPTMYFCWYVIFYIGTMLVMPLFYKLTKVNDFFAVCVVSAVPVALLFVFRNSGLAVLAAFTDYLEYFSYLPCVLIGFVLAKYQVLSILYDALIKGKTAVRIMIASLMIVLPFLARGVNEAFDFLYAPMFIFGLVSIVKILKCKKFLLPLTILGKYSLLLWFLHCAFADQLKDLIQPVLYFPRNPVLVTIFGLAMCLAVAVVLQIPINAINKLKNKIFQLKIPTCKRCLAIV